MATNDSRGFYAGNKDEDTFSRRGYSRLGKGLTTEFLNREKNFKKGVTDHAKEI